MPNMYELSDNDRAGDQPLHTDYETLHASSYTDQIPPGHTNATDPYQTPLFLPDKAVTTPTETPYFIPTRTPPRLTAADFDDSRLQWGTRRQNSTVCDPDYMAYDPLFPDYIIRPQGYNMNVTKPCKEEFDDLAQNAAASEIEMHRLAAGSPVRIPDHFYVVPSRPTFVPHYGDVYAAYIYSEYIEGEVADRHNPAHTPYLLDIGETAARYLESTPIGDVIIDEFLLLSQYRIGRPAAKPDVSITAYMADVQPVRREPKDVRLSAEEAARVTEDTDDVQAFAAGEIYEWVGPLPPSERRDMLLERLFRLRYHLDG